ncbi:MAG: hypothetical protein AAF755_07390 [Pseudomonadota bacterium]
MFETTAKLPKTAMLQPPRDEFAETIKETNAVWFHAAPECFAFEGETSDVASSWRALDAISKAIPTKANKSGIRYSSAAIASGVQCVKGVHCGVVAPQICENPKHFTVAVIYQPSQEGEALTLLSLNAGQLGKSKKQNYLFLSDDGGHYTVKDTLGAIGIEQPCSSSSRHPRMLIVTVLGESLTFQENRNEISGVKGSPPKLAGMTDLFIGCRSHRSGLQKTLGSSIILDVIFFPQQTLLQPRVQLDQQLYTALHRYFLWSY